MVEMTASASRSYSRYPDSLRWGVNAPYLRSHVRRDVSGTPVSCAARLIVYMV